MTNDSVETAAQRLEAAIVGELHAMAEATRDLARRARTLGVGARAINGLQAATAGWARDFEALATKLTEEAPEITKALLGKDPVEITQTFNADLADAVRADRRPK